MKEYRSLIVFLSILFLVGTIFGVILVQSLPITQKEYVLNYLNLFFRDYIGPETIDAKETFWQSSFHYLKISSAIFILGLTVIGIPVVLLFVFAKGVMVGFTSSFLISQMQGKGLLFLLFTVLPQNLLVIPALILLSVGSLVFSIIIVRNRMLRYQGKILPYLFSYFILFIGLNSVLLVASLYESTLAPILLERSIGYILK